MGRFASTVEFYSQYREPYSAEFFFAVAHQFGLRGSEALLDVGCGPGLLAVNFAPFVGHVTGIDPEPGMIAVARQAAAEAGVAISLVETQLEQFSAPGRFDIVTIGRALHWLHRESSLPVLQRIVAPAGRIVICGASMVKSPKYPWVQAYEAARRSWTLKDEEKRYKLDCEAWFSGSGFESDGEVSVSERREVTAAELVKRALSKSNTSLEVLGSRRPQFEAEIIAALEPFSQNGPLREEIVSRASAFVRASTARNS
jgi:SAM-dependent methyltransferase